MDLGSRGVPSLACALVTTLSEAILSLPDVGGDGIISTKFKLEVEGPVAFVGAVGLFGQSLLRCSMWQPGQYLSTLGQFMLGLSFEHSLAQ